MRDLAQAFWSVAGGISLGRAIVLAIDGVNVSSLQHAVAPAFVIVALALVGAGFAIKAPR